MIRAEDTRAPFQRFFGPGALIIVQQDQNSNGIPDNCEVCTGDVDGDQDVDISDLGLVLSQFGMTGATLAGDVDLDGDVDISDLGLLLSAFGTSCAP